MAYTCHHNFCNTQYLKKYQILVVVGTLEWQQNKICEINNRHDRNENMKQKIRKDTKRPWVVKKHRPKCKHKAENINKCSNTE